MTRLIFSFAVWNSNMDSYYLNKVLVVCLSLLFTVEASNKKFYQAEWTDCGGTDFMVKNVFYSPKPFHIPGKANFSMDIIVTTPLENLSGNGTFLKILNGTREEMECKNSSGGFLGSCDSEFLCVEWFPDRCPAYIKAVNSECQCPLPKGMYHVPVFTMDVPLILEAGNYLSRYEWKKDGTMIGCMEANITIIQGH